MPSQQKDPYGVVLEIAFAMFVYHFFGHLRDVLRRMGILSPSPNYVERDRHGYVQLYNSFENFYRRNLMIRGIDLFNTPIVSMPGPTVDIMERELMSDFRLRFTGRTVKSVINMTSYNYLEMNQREGKTADDVEAVIRSHGVSTCSPNQEVGRLDLQDKLESALASFLGVEDALVIGMGFGTNTSIIPSIVKAGVTRAEEVLVLSDDLNHSSIALGCKLSGCVVVRFNHNDMGHLEKVLREGILKGNSRTKRPYRKVVIIVEGVYSMEGTMVNLPEVVRLKKKYKAYLYIDEAHSIGSMGRRGRGVTEVTGVDPTEVDIMMGTFTKSFGGAGGYVAGRREVINYLRRHASSMVYGTSMSPAILQQIMSSLDILSSGCEEGKRKLQALRDNTTFFRRKLTEYGYHVLGHDDSPVVPLMVYNPVIAIYLTRKLREHGVGVVFVSFPAIEIAKARIRFCLSSGHTIDMLNRVLEVLNYFAGRAKVVRTNKGQQKKKDG